MKQENRTPVAGTGAILRLALVLAIVLTAFALVVAPADATGPASDVPSAKFEVRFMQRMIDHHMMAVEMAMMCEEKATHGSLEALCEQIVEAQTQEIMMMHHWLVDWYGIDYMHDMKMTGQMKRLMALEGADFEITFMKDMIRHHWQATVEARQCLNLADHQPLTGLCQDIISDQSTEIELMQTWLRDWYGFHNFGPQVN